jgi:hypothetical protein
MSTSVQAVPRGVRHLKYMYGAVTQGELKGFLEIASMESEQRKQEIRAAWPSAVERFEELRNSEAGVPDKISVRGLAAEHQGSSEQLRQDASFANTFSNFPYSFEEVEIDKLVASQRTVHIEYIDHLTSQYEQGGRNLFEFCLAPAQDVTSISIGRTAQNAFTASSDNPGLRFLGAFEEPYRQGMLRVETPGGQTVRVIVLALGFGQSTANVYRVGTRMILNNGFHRLYTLRTLGVTHAPVVVQQVTHPEVEMPPAIAELPREYVIKNPRPGLMKDFFEDRLTCEVTQRGFLKAVQVGWGVTDSMVPRS